MIHTATIPAWNLDYLSDKVAKLNKRAAKLKVSGFVLSSTPAPSLIIKDEFLNVKKSIPQVTVTISGDTPKIDGWEFVGTIDNLGNGEAIYNAIPGKSEGIDTVDVLASYRECSCDHCEINRFRKQSFVLANEDSYKIVGRSCLKDYVGHASAATLIALASYISSIVGTSDEAGHGGGYRRPDSFDVQGIILRTLAEVKVFGYTSAKSAQAYNDKVDPDSGKFKSTTAQEVRSSYYPDFAKSHPFAEWKARVEKGATALGIKTILGKKDVEKAEVIAKWALEQPEGDFMTNAKTLVRAGYVRMKHMGYVVGLVAFYNASHEPKREYVKKAPSQHIGKVKDKLELTGKVTYLRGFSSDWGFSTLVKIDVDGNQVSWFANGGIEAEIGDTLKIKGNVKALDEYNGYKTTVLTRVKVLERTQAEIKPADETATIGPFVR